MEYTAPVLRVVGTAQALVLGQQMNQSGDNAVSAVSSYTAAGVIGLDD
jgi:hypothetical protein